MRELVRLLLRQAKVCIHSCGCVCTYTGACLTISVLMIRCYPVDLYCQTMYNNQKNLSLVFYNVCKKSMIFKHFNISSKIFSHILLLNLRLIYSHRKRETLKWRMVVMYIFSNVLAFIELGLQLTDFSLIVLYTVVFVSIDWWVIWPVYRDMYLYT